MNLDATHDPALRSWVASANDAATDFPIQNLPYGRFRRAGTEQSWRIGVAIGDQMLDLRAALAERGWSSEAASVLDTLADGDLHRLLHRHPPRHHGGQAVPPGQSPAAQLRVGAYRLSRTQLVDRAQRPRDPPSPGTDQECGFGDTGVRPERVNGLRGGARLPGRAG